jgi:hypothetical protein
LEVLATAAPLDAFAAPDAPFAIPAAAFEVFPVDFNSCASLATEPDLAAALPTTDEVADAAMSVVPLAAVPAFRLSLPAVFPAL